MTDRSVIAYPAILHFSESRHYIREVSPANTMAYDSIVHTHIPRRYCTYQIPMLCFVPDSITLGNGIHYIVYSCYAVVESLTLLSNGFRYIVVIFNLISSRNYSCY